VIRRCTDQLSVEIAAILASIRKLGGSASYQPDLTWLFYTKRCERIAWKGAWVMPKKRFSAEQIVTLLRQIEVSMAQGKSAPEACRNAGISQQSYAMSC